MHFPWCGQLHWDLIFFYTLSLHTKCYNGYFVVQLAYYGKINKSIDLNCGELPFQFDLEKRFPLLWDANAILIVKQLFYYFDLFFLLRKLWCPFLEKYTWPQYTSLVPPIGATIWCGDNKNQLLLHTCQHLVHPLNVLDAFGSTRTFMI